jgi:ribosomal protein L17
MPTAPLQTFGAQPGQNLIDTQINPTGTDRMAIAKQYFDEMQQAGAPAYEAALRSATQREAANGGLGSGQLNTTFGNLALQRAQNLDSLQKQLQTAATEGTIQDRQQAQDALRQERAYQNALQVQALQQQLAEIQLQQNIATQKASYLGSYNPNSNIAGAQAYQSQADALMKSLQDMLRASSVNTNTQPPPPPAPINIPTDFPQAYTP